jgi:hypothetical protein
MMPPVCIVAGGSSLRGFDWNSLHGEHVIAINNAAFRLPFARHVYFADRDWFEHWEHRGMALHLGRIHQGVSDEHEWVDRPWVRRWGFSDDFSMDHRSVYGGCSGNAAINLAAQLGYTELHLLGYDFDSSGNFHDENLHSNHTPGIWRQRFEEMLPALERYGIHIKSGAP